MKCFLPNKNHGTLIGKSKFIRRIKYFQPNKKPWSSYLGKQIHPQRFEVLPPKRRWQNLKANERKSDFYESKN